MADMTRADQLFYVDLAFTDAYWHEFRACGPRHRNVARWLLELGWSIEDSAKRDYLAQDRAHG